MGGLINILGLDSFFLIDFEHLTNVSKSDLNN